MSIFSACSATTPSPKRTAAAESRPVAVKVAVAEITKEKCHLEGACHRIGGGRQFVTEGDCESAFETDLRKAINANTCDTGYVESSSLVECITAIRAGGCTGSVGVYCDTPRICSP